MKSVGIRTIIAGLAAGAAASVLLASPALADWKQYKFDELGIYKDFPVAPTKSMTTYKAPLARTAPATVLTAVDDGVTYTLTVVDFAKRGTEGSNLALEAAQIVSGGTAGTFVAQDFPIWDHGANSVCGIELVVELDGNHIVEDVVFNKGKLYLIKASVPQNSPSRHSLGLARFMDTSQFYLKGYAFNFATGHDYPIGDDNPLDRDARAAAPGYVPPKGAMSGPNHDGPPPGQ